MPGSGDVGGELYIASFSLNVLIILQGHWNQAGVYVFHKNQKRGPFGDDCDYH